ncbi:MAG: hypothetical protein EA400_14775 [Chromatiaceae bacterium]|nr:MAG: hypothetical protein EA400_14775 [Chromatiaceae bacterium]
MSAEGQSAAAAQAIEDAQTWVQAEAPLIWLLGKAQAGKTSIVAEITDQAHAEIGAGYRPMTRATRIYAFPQDDPVLRFIDTRGLSDEAGYDPASDLALAGQQAHLILAVVRVADLDLEPVLAALRRVRGTWPDRPLLVAQTCLHLTYGRHDRHLLPYPFDGSHADGHRVGVPDALRRTMLAQRRLFHGLPGAQPPVFIPIDFTRPEQAVPPADYGAQRLWTVLEEALPEVVARVRARLDRRVEQAVRAKVILPWAFAAAAANAVPVPVLGGLGSASLQAVMVNQVARRLGIQTNLDQWGEFVAALGVGFALGFGGRWLVQQGLKLGLGWGSAIVASWTFAITWGIGEAALYYFGEKAAGREPDRAEMRARYEGAFRRARALYQTRKLGPGAGADPGESPDAASDDRQSPHDNHAPARAETGGPETDQP